MPKQTKFEEPLEEPMGHQIMNFGRQPLFLKG